MTSTSRSKSKALTTKDTKVQKGETLVTAAQKVLQSVAMQLMSGDEVVLDEQKIRVKRVGSGRLRMVQFQLSGRLFEAIDSTL